MDFISKNTLFSQKQSQSQFILFKRNDFDLY